MTVETPAGGETRATRNDRRDAPEDAPIEKIELSEEEFEKLSADSEGGAARKATGWLGVLTALTAFGLGAYALYWTQFTVNTTVYRSSFLSIALALCFILYPLTRDPIPTRRPNAEELVIGFFALVAGGYLAVNSTILTAPGGAGPLALLLVVVFALYTVAPMSRFLMRTQILDWILVAIVVYTSIYLAFNTEAIKTRATRPLAIELVLGAALIFLVLEGTRRSIGWILPAIAALFLVYGYAGPSMPSPFDHRGFSVNRIVGQNYLTLEGIFATPMDVAATFIILFTIYGAVLEKGGAGKFFIDWAFALFGKNPSPSAPGRAVVASGFLLGTVSGSGVATTVTVSSIAWPMLRRSGYHPNVAGGMLAAAGIGATLSPPTLGAAAFIIAEYLDVDYLQVLIYATVPTLLYYLSCWFVTEADAKKLGIKATRTSTESLWQLTLAGGYHFLSLGAIAVFLVLGFSSFMAVFWSIAIAFLLSMIRADSRLVTLQAFGIGVLGGLAAYAFGLSEAARALGVDEFFNDRISVAVFWGMVVATAVSSAQGLIARRGGTAEDPAAMRMADALIGGTRSTLGIIATCACAGIIVSIVNLTGLGLTISGIIVNGAESFSFDLTAYGLGVWDLTRFMTILFAALAMWVLGLAVPVTASYILAAVMLVPALTKLGIPAPAAHMFMFYYAVLADVSPPTALAPFAASAITGGKPFATMMQAWKYTLPAFVVPFMFCLSPEGAQLLAITTDGRNPTELTHFLGIGWATLVAGASLLGLTMAITAHGLAPLNRAERGLALLGGLLLLSFNPTVDVAGFGALGGAIALHVVRVKALRRAETG